MASYAFDQRKAISLLRAFLFFQDVEYEQYSQDARDWPYHRQFDQEVWELTNRDYSDEDVPDEVEINTVHDLDFWLDNVAPDSY